VENSIGMNGHFGKLDRRIEVYAKPKAAINIIFCGRYKSALSCYCSMAPNQFFCLIRLVVTSAIISSTSLAAGLG